jgi:peptide/nickel transport system substrate-binding protein
LEWSDDRKSITFKLRTGVKFHDGTPFDAEAVEIQYRAGTRSQSRQHVRSSFGKIWTG